MQESSFESLNKFAMVACSVLVQTSSWILVVQIFEEKLLFFQVMHQYSWKTKLQISASELNAKRVKNVSEIFHRNTFMMDNLLLWIQNRHSPEIKGIKGRMGKAQILCQSRQSGNWSGEGQDFPIADHGVNSSCCSRDQNIDLPPQGTTPTAQPSWS